MNKKIVILVILFVILVLLIDYNYKCKNNSIEKLDIANATNDVQICNKACDANSLCDFYTLDKTNKVCKLSKLNVNANYVSGYVTDGTKNAETTIGSDGNLTIDQSIDGAYKLKYALFPGKGLNSYDLADYNGVSGGTAMTTTSTVPEMTKQCGALCRDTPKCTAFTLDKTQKMCYLRTGADATDTNKISAFKQPPGSTNSLILTTTDYPKTRTLTTAEKSLCLDYGIKYGAIPNKTWGTIPENLKAGWASSGCEYIIPQIETLIANKPKCLEYGSKYGAVPNDSYGTIPTETLKNEWASLGCEYMIPQINTVIANKPKCLDYGIKYGSIPGESWGTIPTETLKNEWSSLGCEYMVPEIKAAINKQKCIDYGINYGTIPNVQYGTIPEGEKATWGSLGCENIIPEIKAAINKQKCIIAGVKYGTVPGSSWGNLPAKYQTAEYWGSWGCGSTTPVADINAAIQKANQELSQYTDICKMFRDSGAIAGVTYGNVSELQTYTYRYAYDNYCPYTAVDNNYIHPVLNYP